MKKILCLLPGLLIMAALSGCCANDVCNCDDAFADALFLQINYTSHRQYSGGRPSSFSARDIDTIRISRTTRPPANAKDTLSFVRTTDVVTIARRAIPNPTSPADTIIAQTTDVTTTTGTTRLVNQHLIVINNASPFASTSTTKLSGYNYRIEIISYASRRRTPLATYYLTDIDLDGRYDANGCCTCYINSGKTFTLTPRTLTGTPVVATDSVGTRRIVRLPFVPR